MNATELAKQELDDIRTVLASGNPATILHKHVELSALLASLNEQMINEEMAHNKNIKDLLDTDLSVAAAERYAQALEPYRKFKLSRGIAASLEMTVSSLRKYAEILSMELT